MDKKGKLWRIISQSCTVRSSHVGMSAELLQLCPTLCDRMDQSLPGSSVHGDSPGKDTGMSCHSLLQGIFLTQEDPTWLFCGSCIAGGFFTDSLLLNHWGSPISNYQFSSVQSLSRVWLFATPWITARQASLSITKSRSLLRLMSIESVMPSSHLILCCPLLLLPPIPPSIRVFSNESSLHMRWPKYWSFSFSISPSNEHPGLFSFRMDWLDLLAVQGTLNSLLQHHSSKASILLWSDFFIVQLSHLCMTTGKNNSLD